MTVFSSQFDSSFNYRGAGWVSPRPSTRLQFSDHRSVSKWLTVKNQTPPEDPHPPPPSTLLLWVSSSCENLLCLGHSPCYRLQPLVSLTSGLRTLEDPGGAQGLWWTKPGGPGAGQVSSVGLLPGAAPPPVMVLCLALTVCSQLDSFVQTESLQSGRSPSPTPGSSLVAQTRICVKF